MTSGELVYLLSLGTAGACAVLLLRSWTRTRVGLLLWAGLCFIGLALNNLLLFIDLVALPTSVDLSFWRTVPAFVGTAILLFGMIWESR